MDETKINQQIEMLISWFNKCSGSKYKMKTLATRAAVREAIEASGEDLKEIRDFFREFGTKSDNIIDACESYVYSKKRTEEQLPLTVPAQEAKPAISSDASLALDMMGKVMVEMLAKTKLGDIESEVGRRLEQHVKEFVLENYGPITKKIELHVGERKVEIKGVLHEKFDECLQYVADDIPIFLTGPAGSGKNVLCKQIAEALGLRFYFSNAVTQTYILTGFTDAMGHFHESQFYKAFKNGGVFMLDEIDASVPEVLNILNAAIANRYFDFPAPIGFVEASPDFRVVAAGNTFGLGADYDYVGRNQLDAATLNRFHQIRIGYDPRIEEACAMGDADLLKFVRKFRAATKKAGIRVVVSYRNITMVAKMVGKVSVESAIDGSLIKAMDAGDLDTIKDDVMGCGKYSEAFLKVIESRRGWN